MANSSLKLSWLTLLFVVLGSLPIVADTPSIEKPVATQPSSDSGFLFRFHDPIFGFAIEVPAAPLLTYAGWCAWWGLIASGAYGVIKPRSPVALPAQLVLGGMLGVLQGITNVVTMHWIGVEDPNVVNKEGALRAGSFVLALALTYKYWLPIVMTYGYNKLPNPSEAFNRFKEKLWSKLGRKQTKAATTTDDENLLKLYDDVA